MTDSCNLKSEDIEDFLNESFMIIDQLEDNHNKTGPNDKRDSSAAEIEPPNENNVEENEQIEAENAGEEATKQKDGDGECTQVKVEESQSQNDEDVEFLNDTEIEEIASSETYEPNSSDFSKQDEGESVGDKSEDVHTEDLDEAGEEDNAIDCHPYLYLIETFELTKEQKTVTNIGPPKSCTETPLHWVHTRTQLLQLLQTLRGAKEIALDLQVDSKGFNGSIVLLEISTRDSDYIIDGLKLKSELLLLTEIFINPKVVKIQKAEFVLCSLQQLLHLFVVNVFDIEKAGAALDGGKNATKLNMVLKNEYSVECNWGLSSSDFRVRPLPEHLKKYCRTTPHYLIHLYHDYKNRLLKDETLHKDVMDQCRNMCKVLYPHNKGNELSSMEEQLKKRHACQLDVLRKLYDWRQKVAKKNNKNPEMIVPKSVLLNIASDMPIVEDNLLDCCNSHYVRTDGEKLVSMILECREKHHISNKRVRKGKRQRELESKRQRELEREVKSLNEDISNSQGVKRQLNEDKSDNSPNKQKKTKTTFIKPNEKIQTGRKSSEKPSFSQNKAKSTDNRSAGNKVTKTVNFPNKPPIKPPTFVPPRKPNLNKSAPARTNFKLSPFLNCSVPQPLLSLSFNNGPPINSTSNQKNKPRKSRFEPLAPVVLKPTNVPSNSHFQANLNLSGSSFQAPPLNRFQEYSSPLSSFSGGRDANGMNMYPQGNFVSPVGQGGRFNTFNQVFDVIDQKINTLERKVSKFEVTNDPNDMESNMFRRRYN